MATKVERKIIKTNKKHNERRSELHVAAARGDLNRTQSLVLQGAIVNDSSKHWDKATPIFGAAESRVIDTVKYLLRCGADPTHVALSGGFKLSSLVFCFLVSSYRLPMSLFLDPNTQLLLNTY